jgi:hypothetical protein
MGPWGPLGPFGVIPKLFRVESDSEREVFPNPQRAVDEAQILGHVRVALLHVADVVRGPTTQAQGAKGWGPWFRAPLSTHLGRVIFHVDTLLKLVCKMSTKPFW